MALTVADLPGPRGLPWLGNALQLDASQMHLKLEAWAREFGPRYRIKLGPTETIVLSDPELLREVLLARPDRYRRLGGQRRVFSELGIDSVFTNEGDQWRRTRRLVMASFVPKQIERMFPRIQAVTQRLQKRWEAAARAGETVDAHADLVSFSGDVATWIAFGRDVNTLEQGAEELREQLGLVLPAINERLLALVPVWRWFQRPKDRVLLRALEALRTRVGAMITEARARLAANPELAEAPETLLEAMIVARDEETGAEAFSDEELFANVMIILLAGEDTTSSTAAWALHHVAGSPAVQQRLAAEVDAFMEDGQAPRDVKSSRAMPYVNGVIFEALRLRSAASMVSMQAREDTALGDLAVPKRSIVLCLLRQPGLRDEVFGDAARFDPSRWVEDERSPELAHDAKSLLAFGYGPRICPGRTLALVEMAMVVSMAARHFEIEGADEQPPREEFGFTMQPSSVRLRLRLREA